VIFRDPFVAATISAKPFAKRQMDVKADFIIF